jgi:low affinity Fe/Cu permease
LSDISSSLLMRETSARTIPLGAWCYNIRMAQKGKEKNHRLQDTALTITGWVGSPQSIVVHSVAFIASFAAVTLGLLSFDRMLLVLTTIVSLEAIYLSIFIQMTINVTTKSLEEVEQNLDEIQEDVGEIQEDMGEIQEDIDEMQEDVEELQEDVEEMTEEESVEEAEYAKEQKTLEQIHEGLLKLMQDIEKLQSKQ